MRPLRREKGKLFNMDYAAISQSIKKFEDKIKIDKKTLTKKMFIKRLKGINAKC